MAGGRLAGRHHFGTIEVAVGERRR